MMANPIRTVLLLVSSLAALLGAAALVAWLFIDTEGVTEQLQAELGDALGMEVQIGQPPRFSLLRGASVRLADIEVSRQGQLVATVENARLRIALFSLLSGNVRLLELHLQRPELSIERISPGVFNIFPFATESEALKELSLRSLQVSDARLSYLDRTSDLEWLFEQCDLDLRNIGYATLTGDGGLNCGSLSQQQFAITQLSVEISADNRVLILDPVRAQAFEGQVSGRLTVDLSSEPPEFRLTSTLSQFEIGAFMASINQEQTASGTMDLELVLSAAGKTWQEVRNSSAGTLSMTAGDLVIDGFDLDDELDGYAATQRFNLIDVGAVFLAGPVGLVASRGYAFSGLLEGSGGSTRIVQMVSEWTIENGVAQARDVAFRTPENRLALTGGLDFTRYRFNDLQVAVVDRDGCAIVEQTITGPFREPQINQPNFLVAVVGPLFDLINRGLQAATDEECEAFYSGSIPHP